MKRTIASLFLILSASAFSCADFTGEYVCEDQYSYRYYRSINISEELVPGCEKALKIMDNGHKKYGRILRVDGVKSPMEDMTIKTSCIGNVLKVKMGFGNQSSTDSYKLTKTGMIFSTEEEVGRKKLNCKRVVETATK